ncbi:MAG: polysaccharide lyase [Bacteroidales bacterium]|jgi:hypothetical protein|nr:polysaccharide lyase [Bacteroidales bacterium]
MKKILLFSSVLMLAANVWAQYPTIPDSTKARGAEQQAKWNELDKAAWDDAVPKIMDDMLNGKPYVPWCAQPSDLKQASIPAFPGAMGGGMYSFGGRGGKIYVVTSLADSGPGTLREACEAAGARIVVFNVAGEIRLERPINVKAPYITIFGQTAPGNGVVITRHSLLVDTHDVVIRYMRFRRGSTDVAFRDDACGGNGLGNIIYDHCSASWGLDEVMSMYRHVYARNEKGYGTKLPTVNITIQNCMFAEGLDMYNHGFGASIGGHNTLFARNLFANNISRNPSVAMDGDFNFVNNVLYNWWNRSIDGGDNNSQFNIVNNYLKPGPITGYDVQQKAIDPKASIRWRILKPESGRSKEQVAQFGKAYVGGNIVDGYPEVTADNWAGGVQPAGIKTRQGIIDTLKADAPFPMPYIDTIYTAADAYEVVLANVGATKPMRDAVDERIIRTVRSGQPEYAKNAKPCTSPYVKRRLPDDSYKLGIITDPQQVGGLPQYKGKPRKDSDGDGIPDEWEKANGLDPNNSNDAKTIREDGYMNIEWYANSL